MGQKGDEVIVVAQIIGIVAGIIIFCCAFEIWRNS